MASRRAVAASVASVALFSSLILSNYIIFSGGVQGLRSDSLAAQERAYFDKALVLRSLTVLDLIDGAQVLITSGHFSCSDADGEIRQLLATERVELTSGGISSVSGISLAPDATAADNLTTLRPFAGAVGGWINMMTNSRVRGESPDGTVVYDKAEVHLLALPLRLNSLSADCIATWSRLLSALGALGRNLCNSTILSREVASASSAASLKGGEDGFSVSVGYGIVSTRPCGVGFTVTAAQTDIEGTAGNFRFTEEEAGLVWASSPGGSA
jgi:hypothetical protein